MSRLGKLTPEELDEEQRALYESIAGSSRRSFIALTDGDGALVGPFNAYLYSPRIGDLVQQLGVALRASENLSRRAQELVILATAADCDSEFELYAHERIAVQAGLSEEIVRAVVAGEHPPLDDPVEQQLLRTTRMLLARGDLDDAAYEQAIDALGPAGLFEVATLVGYYRLIALQLRLFRVPAPD